VDLYARVRRAVQVDGMSMRNASREFGLSRKTIRKMMGFSVPPGYVRKKPIARPKLGPWLGVIDQILEDDKSQPKKQRHTAKRIWDRLKAEHGFGGGYTIVKDYVRDALVRHKEVFVPLAHPPGDAQADFGEALVVIGECLLRICVLPADKNRGFLASDFDGCRLEHLGKGGKPFNNVRFRGQLGNLLGCGTCCSDS
jgi:transposase